MIEVIEGFAHQGLGVDPEEVRQVVGGDVGAGVELGVDPSWAQGHGLDAGAGKFIGEALGEGEHPRLDGRVIAGVDPGARGGDVEDGSVAAGLHGSPGCGREHQNRPNHDLEGSVLQFEGVRIEDLGVYREAGVVDEQIDVVGGILETCGYPIDVLALREVRLDRLDGHPVTGFDVRLDGGHPLGVAGDDHDVVATGSQLGDELAANT